jgi:hypothetical protein
MPCAAETVDSATTSTSSSRGVNMLPWRIGYGGTPRRKIEFRLIDARSTLTSIDGDDSVQDRMAEVGVDSGKGNRLRCSSSPV